MRHRRRSGGRSQDERWRSRGRRAPLGALLASGALFVAGCGAEPVHIGPQPSPAPAGADAQNPRGDEATRPGSTSSPGAGALTPAPPSAVAAGTLVAGGAQILPLGVEACGSHDGQVADGHGLTVVAAVDGGHRLVLGDAAASVVVVLSYPTPPPSPISAGVRLSFVGTVRRPGDPSSLLGALGRLGQMALARDGCYIEVSDPSSPFVG